MKYTYFSTVSSGKYLLRSQFWYNRRSCAFLSQSRPMWCVLSSPIGNLDKLEWYWCDKDTKLSKHSHFLDTSDKLVSSHYDEIWFPIPDHRGYETIPRDQWITHENFYGCVDSIMSRDLITNPFGLLGYTGKLGSNKMMSRMVNHLPNLTPPPHIIEELRKRCNIVPYKENIEHLAYNLLSIKGRLPFEQQCEWINQNLEFQRIIPVILKSYDIPYEMFSLDTGSYAKTFGLDKTLPRDSSDTLFHEHNPKIDEEVKKYMDTYHTL